MNATLSVQVETNSPSLGYTPQIARRVALTGAAVGSLGVLAEWPRVVTLIWPVPVSVLGRLAALQFCQGLFLGAMIASWIEVFWWLRDGRRTAVQKIVGIATMVVMPGLYVLVVPLLPLPYSILVEYGMVGSLHAFWLFIFWENLVMSLLTLIYLTRKRQIFAEDTRIARANREWEMARRGVLESRLQAIQARVEPQLLFDSLSRMRERYHSTLEDGEGLLEALTEFLRCGLPHMRSATGTIFLECELLKSYALLLRSAAFSRPLLTCDLDPEAAAVTIAAGGLQGLVAPWLRSVSVDQNESFEIVARRSGHVVSITVTGPIADLGPAPLATQQTLKEIHGSKSLISHRRVGGRLEYRIEYSDNMDRPVTSLELVTAHGDAFSRVAPRDRIDCWPTDLNLEMENPDVID